MTNIITKTFFTSNKEVRSIWWVVIFFLILSLFLFPIILLADYYSAEVTFWHQGILIMAVSILCQALKGSPLHELTGRINKAWFKELCMGSMIGAALMIMPAILLTSFGTIHWQVNELSTSAFVSGISILVGGVLAEELLFRGFIFQRLIDSVGKWPAQLVIAGLFLLTHLNNPGMTGIVKTLASINIFIASILFGLAYIKTKGLAMPVGLHLMANVVQGTVLGFSVSGEKETSLFIPVFDKSPTWLTGGMFGLEASVPGLLVLVVITSVLYFWYPLNSKIEINR